MNTPVMDLGCADPCIPSLFHLAVFKIAIPLLNDLDIQATDSVLTEIQHSDSARFDKSIQENCKANRAKEILQLIPAHLRLDVLRAVVSMHHAISDWKEEHSEIIDIKDGECVFYWRYDGLIDTVKTAQQLILNANISIEERFDLACMYCLEKSVISLWAEMEESDKKRYTEADYDCMMHFWVTWLNEGCRIPWLQAIRDYFHFHKVISGVRIPNLGCFFPLLQQQERWQFVSTFSWAAEFDLRLCLHVLSKAEKLHLQYLCPLRILTMYLEWPLQSFFLEKAEKLFHLIDNREFICLLHKIWLNHAHWKKRDFDYYKLFVDFWNVSPQHFRESAEEDPLSKKDLDLCFNIMRQKRKNDSSDTNQNKMMRKN